MIVKNKLYVVLIFALLLLSSCRLAENIHAISRMNNCDIKVKNYTYFEKNIKFVGVTHYGEKAFYSSLTDSIHSWKEQDYTIYYESIRAGMDSYAYDTLSYFINYGKFRKITNGRLFDSEFYRKEYDGFVSFESEFEILNSLEFKRSQPTFAELGVDSTDVNADISIVEFVEAYENIYGKVVLDACDRKTIFGDEYTCGGLTNSLSPIIEDYRNEMLAKTLQSAIHDKIIVVYGYRHRKGLVKNMKKLEKNK